ncbi:nucleolar protein 10 [Conger conger]|uniref:nucleolar protein 10 n=1 Tax=Conger conger TaxID=82655 RepID=UPI002A5AB1E7|nr:nucleolar protein 10 [Conger conger]
MQVSSVNDVKIYNLSHGKSLPEWLSDRKKRALQKQDADVQRRIELIQDFDMPTVCTSIKVSRDGQYILAAGTYKPRIRCYDTYQLSLKFERCLDSDVVAFDILSDDYSKLVFLHCDRYVEFHSQHGHYYKTRIPKFGRDFSYHYPSCDLYFVGASSEVYRLNLEQGRFLNSLQTDAVENNVCDINPVHQLFATGTAEGKVECWDPRTRARVGILDCALSSVTEGTEVEGLPSISALKFNRTLNMAVGTSTGQVLLYDLRSSHPLLVKDHYYGLPIKSLNFQNQLDLVLSADSKIIKIWNQDTGKLFSSIEPQTDVNDVCVYPDSGMLFTANEDPKMSTFYVPVSLTPSTAPLWRPYCLWQGPRSPAQDGRGSGSFPQRSGRSPLSLLGRLRQGGLCTRRRLRSAGERPGVLTQPCDWSFFPTLPLGRLFWDTRLWVQIQAEEEGREGNGKSGIREGGEDLENLGLSHLVGSALLRAYMHGFFMDIRLYHKVKTMANPFAYEEYRKDKIRQKIEEQRTQRVQIKKLPQVNKELAIKLMEEGEEEEPGSRRKKGKATTSILNDNRFKVMFENPDYQVDEQSEEFRLLNPIVSKVGLKRRKKLRLLEKQAAAQQKAEQEEEEEEEEEEGRASSEESSDDDDKSWVEEVREQRRLLREEERTRRRQERKQDREASLESRGAGRGAAGAEPRFFQIKAGEEFRSFGDVGRRQRLQKASLADRLKLEEHSGALTLADSTVGSKQLTFTLKKSERQQQQQQGEREHQEERKKLRRSAGHLQTRGRGRGRGWGRGRGRGRGRF